MQLAINKCVRRQERVVSIPFFLFSMAAQIHGELRATD